MSILATRFLKTVSNSFGNRVGGEAFNTSRLPIYISRAETEMANDVPSDVYVNYKKQYGQVISNINKLLRTEMALTIDDSSVFSANDFIGIANEGDFYATAVIKEIPSATTITVYADTNDFALEDGVDLFVYTSLRWNLDYAIICKTVSKFLPKLVSLNEDNAVNVTENTGIASKSIVDIHCITSLMNSYEIDYNKTINQYQESPNGIRMGLI
jgi:hypothetical protein